MLLPHTFVFGRFCINHVCVTQIGMDSKQHIREQMYGLGL